MMVSNRNLLFPGVYFQVLLLLVSGRVGGIFPASLSLWHFDLGESIWFDRNSEFSSWTSKLTTGGKRLLDTYRSTKSIPSRKLTYPTLGSSETHPQTCVGRGYVSSLEGALFSGKKTLHNITVTNQKVTFLSKKQIPPFDTFSDSKGIWFS